VQRLPLHVFEALGQLSKLTGRTTPERLALDMLGELDYRDRAPSVLLLSLLRWARDPSHAVAVAACEAMQRIADDLSDQEMLWFERRVRNWHGDARAMLELRRPFDALTTADVERLARLAEASGPAVLGVASMHTSGWVRGASVKRLAESRTGGEVPFLLMRLADWVLAVRSVAKEALEARLGSAAGGDTRIAQVLVCHLDMADAMAERALAATFLRDAIKALTRSPASAAPVREGLSSPNLQHRRRCYRIALEHGLVDPFELLSRALADGDAGLHQWAARSIPPRLEGEPRQDALRAMLRDRVAQVRKVAVAGLGQGLSSPDLDGLTRALHDPSSGVREEARFQLGRLGPFDARAHYRAALDSADPGALPGVLLGLADVGAKDDGERVLPFLSHPARPVREAAVIAAGKIAFEMLYDRLARSLLDPHRRVVRAALRQLEGRMSFRDDAPLLSVLAEEERPFVRRAVVRLLGQLDPWTALGALLEALMHPAPEVVALVQDELRAWPRENPVTGASAAQRERIARALRGATHALDEALFGRFARIVMGWPA
jgi:HEAT repeat protein